MENGQAIPQAIPHILLVEDSQVEAELLRRTVSEAGYRVTVTHNGEEALKVVLATPPDLVMSDIRMPRMDGYTLCRAIKRDATLNRIPVILLSVLSEPDDIIEAINAGADSYTTKPFTESSLLGRIKSLLSSSVRAPHQPGDPLEVEYRGKMYRIATDPQQMLNLLLSVYENTLVQNRELIAVQAQLCLLNETLEEKVRERTAELQASEARFRGTFEQAAVGIALVAPDGRLLRVNQRLCEIVACSMEEILALTSMQLTEPADREATLTGMRQLLSGQTESHRHEKRLLRKNGDRVWVHQTLSLVYQADGHPDYFIAVIADISERKAAQDAVIRLNAELEHRVAMRTAELQHANAELENFASAVSHDLRTPLRALTAFSSMLQRDCSERLKDNARNYVDQIQQNTQRMGDLIEGLLTLARNTRGEMRYDSVELSSLARKILDELTSSHRERQVDVDIEPGVVAQGDARMLEALMANLLGNAWKYTLHTEKPVIRFYSKPGRKGISYCVTDNGAGFDMAYAERLFQPFQRLHRQEEFPGLGIGLATVKRIVERHGGEIQASAKVGEGAAFCFTLPTQYVDDTTPA